jgi:hypothetical protein
MSYSNLMFSYIKASQIAADPNACYVNILTVFAVIILS